jgi:protein involved in polysaccharide export with SLBB domain
MWAFASSCDLSLMLCRRAIVCCLFAWLVGCTGEAGPPRNLPAPEQSTIVGPDDLFEINVLGEKDLTHEFQVQPDGTIDFPYLSRVKVEGLEPQEVVDVLKRKLIDGKILSDPQITLIVKQYNSKKVLVTGAVQKPDSVSWNPGMTLVDAISRCGWFTPLADTGHITLIRRVGKNKTIKATVSVDAITHHTQEDIPLQPADTISIEQRVF